jgi:hypothetical protein
VTAPEVLAAVAEAGARLYLSGGAIRATGSRLLSEDIKAAIRLHKATLLELLARSSQPCSEPMVQMDGQYLEAAITSLAHAYGSLSIPDTAELHAAETAINAAGTQTAMEAAVDRWVDLHLQHLVAVAPNQVKPYLDAAREVDQLHTRQLVARAQELLANGRPAA